MQNIMHKSNINSYESLWKENKEMDKKIKNIRNKFYRVNNQKKLKKQINEYKIEIDNIRLRLEFDKNPTKIINKKFKNINDKIIEKYSNKFNDKFNYVYIFDALNIEGGRINKFVKIRNIIEKNDKLKWNKILIIVRSVLRIQSLEEDNECKKLVKKYKNITIKYIHTTVKLNKKEFVLVNSCNNSDYCTDSHRKSKIKLCTAPIIEYLKLQPNHAVCEIDDILVYYHSLLSSNSKIISKTENYSKTIGLNEIYSLKLLLNIPITVYVNKKKYLININPLKIMDSYLDMYKQNKVKRKRVIFINSIL